MSIANILGGFSDLQKFSSITESQSVVREFSNEEQLDKVINVTAKFKIKTEISLLGERDVTIEKHVKKRNPGSRYAISESSRFTTASLRVIAEKVEQLNYGCRSTPKQFWYVPPEERQAVYDITARICELYKETDQQIAEAPFSTRAICWLTNNSLFPEYRLRQRLENGEYSRPIF